MTAYDVYQADSRVHSVPGTATTARVTGPLPGKVYTFTIRARDAADNSSPDSVPLDLTTVPAAGTAPSTAPTALSAGIRPAGSSSHTVELAWTPPHTGARVREYQLFLNGGLATTIVWGARPKYTPWASTRYSVNLTRF